MSGELRGSHEQPNTVPPNVIVCKTVIDPGAIQTTLEQLTSGNNQIGY
jgi:hypothetical protein